MTNREPVAAPVPRTTEPHRPEVGPAPAKKAVQDITSRTEQGNIYAKLSRGSLTMSAGSRRTSPVRPSPGAPGRPRDRSGRLGQQREDPFVDQFIDRSAVEAECAVDIDRNSEGANSRIIMWKIRISSEVVECYIETTRPENG
ncbi:hypothetical protein GCM10009647_056060 [Streptomyces sanglieri]